MSDTSDSEIDLKTNHHDTVENECIGGEDGDHYGVPYEARVKERSQHRHSAVRMKPDVFTGQEDWDQYILYFEDLAQLAQWSEREKLLYLATSLKQQARVHYSSLPIHEKRSYSSLVTRLEQRFGSKRQQTRWLSKIQNRTRAKGEAIAEFGDEIRLLAQKAYVSLGDEAQEMLALQHFYRNVSPPMRCRLIDKGCKNIMEAVEVVERYEEVMGEDNSGGNIDASSIRGVISNNNGNPPVKSNSDLCRLNDEKQEIKEALKRIENRLESLEAKQQGRQCYYCGSSSHSVRSCPRNRKQSGPKFNRNQGNAHPSSQ